MEVYGERREYRWRCTRIQRRLEEAHVLTADGGTGDDEPSGDDTGDDDAHDDDEEPFEDEEDDEEEEEHLAPADSLVIPVVDVVPSAGDTEAFKTNELHLT
ncbi:hypothetical protein Tco_0831476 [Tanacetum coccineum]